MRSRLPTEARMEERERWHRRRSQKRFPVALVLSGALALLVWFTMDAGKVMVMGRAVELRLLPLVILAGLALRTVLARQAERIAGKADSGQRAACGAGPTELGRCCRWQNEMEGCWLIADGWFLG